MNPALLLVSWLLLPPQDGAWDHDVVWTTPGADASGSMPLGNGEVGLNLWVEEGGDLVFTVARTDAWSEVSRLLKLGRIRVRLSPNPFAKGAPFRQTLRLREGAVHLAAGPPGSEVLLRIFVDARAPVIYVAGESARPLEVRAAFETWRTQRTRIQGEALESCWTMREAPGHVELWESADVVAAGPADAVVWYHRNEGSIVPFTLRHQGCESLAPLVLDPLIRRTFGGRMEAPGFAREGAAGLASPGPVKSFALRIATHASQPDSAEAWERELAAIAAKAGEPAAAATATAAWWDAFWARSWIRVGGGAGDDPSLSRITQAYVLQRWMAACAGRGAYPIKFNGSLFTVEPVHSGGPRQNADWRRWGDAYWWQNTRLPYFPLPASGDLDLLEPLFRFYRGQLPLAKARTKLYTGAEGVCFQETVSCFGTASNGDYGWKREGRAPGDFLNLYIRHIWQQGLELLMLMLDAYEHGEDARFLAEELVPMAREVLRYFDTRFPRDPDGRLRISPTQAVETYWYDVENDTPCVAGLHAVAGRLLALPAAAVPAEDRGLWMRMQASAPALPVREEAGRRFVLPAEKFRKQRSNCENPELYAVWPFRLFSAARPDLATGVETWRRRGDRGMNGWSYDGQAAAILGLTAEARQQILHKVGNSNPRHRFPAMWGPNFDWVPDQDHGSSILLTLQHMVLLAEGERILLLPAWPKEWNLKFRLHAPRRTIVEGEFRDGRMQSLRVEPAARRADVTVCEPR